ncbi:MAG: hypothetical protein RLZZ373_851 [Pseudomonadota bacterium]
MNNAVMFGRATDEWATPRELFKELDREFYFGLDAAATADNALCLRWLTDALAVDWAGNAWGHPIYLNPPYSRCREFIGKAALEASRGATVVCLVPSRTDTRWWHEHVWDREQHTFRPGVEARFIKGRLKFGDSTNSAPFPSVILIFRPTP